MLLTSLRPALVQTTPSAKMKRTVATMNARWLMRASALFLGIAGVAATFLPHEILAYAGTPAAACTVAVVQIAGALYLGFAMLNWMGRGNAIGGIYSRPVAIGNLAHFTVAALALLKYVVEGHRSAEVVVIAVAYAAFAVLFAALAFGTPALVRRHG